MTDRPSRWSDPEAHPKGWGARAGLLAQHIAGPRVIEIGAGKAHAREMLVSRGLTYLAFDLKMTPYVDGVLDLNSWPCPSLPDCDSFLLSGVLEYVRDVRQTIHNMSQCSTEIVFSYASATPELPARELERRTSNGWTSHFSLRGLADLVNGAGLNLSMLGEWSGQVLLKARR